MDTPRDEYVRLDRTGLVLLDALADALRNEPQEPNGDMPLATQDEYAKAHLKWADTVNAYRHLLGIRLVSEALETTHLDKEDRA